MLKLVEHKTELWEKLEDEPESAWLAFAGWLMLGQTRNRPSHSELCTRYRWAERARAYDRAMRAPKVSKDRLAEAGRMLTEVVFHEAEKMLEAARGHAPSLTPRDLVAVISVLVDARTTLSDVFNDTEPRDLSTLTDEQLAQVMAAHKVLAGAR